MVRFVDVRLENVHNKSDYNQITIGTRDDHYWLEVELSGRRAGVDTDRASLVKLRDQLDKMLGEQQ